MIHDDLIGIPGLSGSVLEPDFIACTPKELPSHLLMQAAQTAVSVNPANNLHVASATADAALRSFTDPLHIASLIGKAWKPGTVIPVAFLEPIPADLRDRILSHLRAWRTEAGANIDFAWSKDAPWVRITREGDGYWSYVGTDILSIPVGQPTMSLQGFTMTTPEQEFRRVVRHEGGHSLSYVHEHSRREIVALLDPERTIAYFRATQGWTEAMIRAQILTPIEESSVMGTSHAEQDSLMAYQFSGACTKNGQPIPGGLDITPGDAAFARKLFPGLDAPPVEPPSPVDPLAPDKPAPNPRPRPPSVANAVRGYVALSRKKAPRKLVVYVPGEGGAGEVGWEFSGPFDVSKGNPDCWMFQGKGRRLEAGRATGMESGEGA